jgi:hypothetical protein
MFSLRRDQPGAATEGSATVQERPLRRPVARALAQAILAAVDGAHHRGILERGRLAIPLSVIRAYASAQGQGTVVTCELPPSLLRHLRSEGFSPTVAST